MAPDGNTPGRRWRGGRKVLGKWPGLAEPSSIKARPDADHDLRAVMKTVLYEHMRVPRDGWKARVPEQLGCGIDEGRYAVGLEVSWMDCTLTTSPIEATAFTHLG